MRMLNKRKMEKSLMVKLADINGISAPASSKYLPSKELVLPKNFMGVEVELENINPSRNGSLPPSWRTVGDGSLRGDGMEFVLREPMFGQDLVEALQGLYEHLGKKQKNFRISERTGIHLHMDMRECSMEEVRKFLLVYTVMERLLFKYSGITREQSIFCIPIHKSEYYLDMYHMLGQRGSTVHSFLQRYHRYASLNLNALLRFGSVEFRHMPTSSDVGEIIRWINVVQSIKKFTSSTSLTGLSLLARIEKYDPVALIEEVFNTGDIHLADSFLNLPLNLCIGRGIKDAYAMALWQKLDTNRTKVEGERTKGKLFNSLYKKDLDKSEEKRSEGAKEGGIGGVGRLRYHMAPHEQVSSASHVVGRLYPSDAADVPSNLIYSTVALYGELNNNRGEE